MARSEDEWRKDLVELLKKELSSEQIIVKGGFKILKDLFIQNEKGTNKIQLGFFDQDIVIYKKQNYINIKALRGIEQLKVFNTTENELIIPSIIIELKYNGVNTHGIMTYSSIASNIKSIFPLCKYIFALRYNNGSSDNKFLRNGKNFDKILYFDETSSNKNYVKGDFKKELNKNNELKEKWDVLIDFIKTNLESENKGFVK